MWNDKTFFNLCNNKKRFTKSNYNFTKRKYITYSRTKGLRKIPLHDWVLTKRSRSGSQILYLHHMDVSPLQLKSSFVFWQVTYKWQIFQYIIINVKTVHYIFKRLQNRYKWREWDCRFLQCHQPVHDVIFLQFKIHYSHDFLSSGYWLKYKPRCKPARNIYQNLVLFQLLSISL